MNNNNGNSRYTFQKVLNLFSVHGKCDNVLSGNCRIFNENYGSFSYLLPITKGKLKRTEANLMYLGPVCKILNWPRAVVDNEHRQLNILLYFEANSTTSIETAEEYLGISRCSVGRTFLPRTQISRLYNIFMHKTPTSGRINLCEMSQWIYLEELKLKLSALANLSFCVKGFLKDITTCLGFSQSACNRGTNYHVDLVSTCYDLWLSYTISDDELTLPIFVMECGRRFSW